MTKQITISSSHPVSVEAIYALYQQMSWAASRTSEDIRVMLDNTSLWLGAWQGERLVGFVRVLSDDRYRAFIEDVIVDEAARGQGVGHQLIEQVMQRLAHIEEVMLVCEERLVPFYEQHGFERTDYPTAMKWRRSSG